MSVRSSLKCHKSEHSLCFFTISHFLKIIVKNIVTCSYSHDLKNCCSLKGVFRSITYNISLHLLSILGEDAARGQLFPLERCFCTFKYQHERDAVG